MLGLLLMIPLIGILMVSVVPLSGKVVGYTSCNLNKIKTIGLSTSMINLLVSIIVFMFFNFSSNQFQFVQEYYKISNFDFYLGVDGISMYFVLLTTVIMPISLLSN